MRRLAPVLALLAALGGCRWIRYSGTPYNEDEQRLSQEVKLYYSSVQAAFAARNSDALTSLFDPSITHPMTQPQIKAWGEKFFKENAAVSFIVEKLEIESVAFVEASVLLTYRVSTPGGKGDFGGVERDRLVKKKGHWYINSWDKVVPGH